jgi:hypothetical protein
MGESYAQSNFDEWETKKMPTAPAYRIIQLNVENPAISAREARQSAQRFFRLEQFTRLELEVALLNSTVGQIYPRAANLAIHTGGIVNSRKFYP